MPLPDISAERRRSQIPGDSHYYAVSPSILDTRVTPADAGDRTSFIDISARRTMPKYGGSGGSLLADTHTVHYSADRLRNLGVTDLYARRGKDNKVGIFPIGPEGTVTYDENKDIVEIKTDSGDTVTANLKDLSSIGLVYDPTK